MKDIYIKSVLPSGSDIEVLEIKGRHLWSALHKAAGDPVLTQKYVIMQVVYINGRLVTEELLYDLSVDDTVELMSIVSVQLNQLPK